MNQSPTITIILKSLRKASRYLMRDFSEIENLQASNTNLKSFVAASRAKIAKILEEELLAARPKFGLLIDNKQVSGEDSAHRWVVSTMSGQDNFLHGSKLFCISVALEKKHVGGSTEIIAAAIDVPILQEVYVAEKGNGVWIEEGGTPARRLRVASRVKLHEAMACVEGDAEYTNLSVKLRSNSGAVRVIGSAALELAYVASGAFDVVVHSKVSYNEVAAGILLVQEAGGVVSDYDNRAVSTKIQNIIAANDNIHKIIRKSL